MDQKYLKVLSILDKSEQDNLTASFIAQKLGISSRSIKSYISAINEIYPGLINSSPNGYQLNREIYEQVDQEKEEVPQDKDERVSYIIRYLLSLENGEKIDINDLSEEIYVSYATIRRDLQEAISICDHYHIKLNIANDFVSLQGKEKDKRALINAVYSKEFEKNELSIENLQKLFPDYDLEQIKTVIIEKCKEYNYLLNGYTVDQIVLDIVIGIDRMKHSFDSDQGMNTYFNVHELNLAKAITSEFEKMFDIHYSEEEINEFTIILVSHLLKIDYQTITKENLANIVGHDIYNLAEEIISETDDYFIRNQNEDFFIRFALHLKNLMLRAQTNYINQNLLTETIKTSCPLLFDCAVNISNIIFNKTGYQINDDEIAYITIHIGSLLETSNEQKINCGLIMPKYYNLSEEIRSRIEERISSDASLKLIPEEEYNQYNTLDLIITNNPNIRINPEKRVLFSGIINKKELDTISDRVSEIKEKKKIETILNQLLTISSDKFFYKNPVFTDKDSLIRMMADDLLDSGVVSYDYFDNVMQRESISSTAFNSIAVPHTLVMNANQTMISIVIFDKAVAWGNRKVNLVFMFAIHPNDKKLFHFIFDNLVSLLVDDDNVLLLKEANSYHEFIDRVPMIKNY